MVGTFNSVDDVTEASPTESTVLGVWLIVETVSATFFDTVSDTINCVGDSIASDRDTSDCQNYCRRRCRNSRGHCRSCRLHSQHCRLHILMMQSLVEHNSCLATARTTLAR